MKKTLLSFLIGMMMLCAMETTAQSIVAYNALTYFGVNAEESVGFPTFLILPAEYARSQELADLDLRTKQTFIENPSITNALVKKMENNLKKIKASGEADPESIQIIEKEIADMKEQSSSEFSDMGNNEDLEAMRKELMSHAVVKKYFWAAETMYGNIVAVCDRKTLPVLNYMNKVWGIMNDKGKMIIPCEYKQGAEFNWCDEKLDVILLRDFNGVHLFNSKGKLITDKAYWEVKFCESDAYTAVVVMLDKTDFQTGRHLYGLLDPKTGREIHQHEYEEILSANGGKGPIYGLRNHDNKRYILAPDGRETESYSNSFALSQNQETNK